MTSGKSTSNTRREKIYIYRKDGVKSHAEDCGKTLKREGLVFIPVRGKKRDTTLLKG